MLRSLTWLGWPSWNICVTNDHGYIPLIVNTFRSFPHSRLITGFVTILTRRVPIVQQELLTLPEHLSSPLVFSGVHVTRSLVWCVCFVDRCLSFVLFLLAIVLSVLLRYADYDYLPVLSPNCSYLTHGCFVLVFNFKVIEVQGRNCIWLVLFKTRFTRK